MKKLAALLTLVFAIALTGCGFGSANTNTNKNGTAMTSTGNESEVSGRQPKEPTCAPRGQKPSYDRESTIAVVMEFLGQMHKNAAPEILRQEAEAQLSWVVGIAGMDGVVRIEETEDDWGAWRAFEFESETGQICHVIMNSFASGIEGIVDPVTRQTVFGFFDH